jgi:hypothetical protein
MGEESERGLGHIPEPNDFQPFNLQALRNLYKAKDTPRSRPAGLQSGSDFSVCLCWFRTAISANTSVFIFPLL